MLIQMLDIDTDSPLKSHMKKANEENLMGTDSGPQCTVDIKFVEKEWERMHDECAALYDILKQQAFSVKSAQNDLWHALSDYEVCRLNDEIRLINIQNDYKDAIESIRLASHDSWSHEAQAAGLARQLKEKTGEITKQRLHEDKEFLEELHAAMEAPNRMNDIILKLEEQATEAAKTTELWATLAKGQAGLVAEIILAAAVRFDSIFFSKSMGANLQYSLTRRSRSTC